MNKLVSVESLSVRYGGHLALEGVDLNIFDNDFLGVIGPNGGGKSTLVKAILSMVPYSGKINYSESIYNNGRFSIGYLPQQNDFDRNFPISVREVVLSGLQSRKGLFGRYTSADKALATSLLENVGIPHLARKPIGEISGGEMQRTLLCRAIISDPRILILDEPTNFVDNKFEKQLYSLLQELSRRMAIVMVSHDLGTISSVVRSIVCVNKHVHRHDSNVITAEQLHNYDCPIQIISHGHVPHTVLEEHN